MLELKPNEKHPITIGQLGHNVTVEQAGQTIADSNNAIVLQEASYPPVIYIPRRNIKMDLLERSEHTSYCPYKGEAAYYHIVANGKRVENAIWTYEAPYEAVEEIKDYLAFYRDRVDHMTEVSSAD